LAEGKPRSQNFKEGLCFMMRSLFSGVSGLKTHQTKMDVIGNNIANVNTTSFKASSIVFNELMAQTTQNASGANAATGTGGVNARQIGLGVKSGAININVTGQGASQNTGNPFDLMITGENFFIVNNGISNYFTRDGSFYVDGLGNLAMTSSGYNVMGWQVSEETGEIKPDRVSALRIMSTENLTYQPEATSLAYMSGILDSNDSDVRSATGRVVNLNFFDNLGASYSASFTFKQSDDEHEYAVELNKLLDAKGNEVELTDEQKQQIFGTGIQSRQAAARTAKFDEDTYLWKDNALYYAEDKSTPIFNVGDLVETVNGTVQFKDLSTTIGTGDDAKTVGDALDILAKAYSYSGKTEEFLNLYQNPAVTEVSDAPVTMPQLLTAGALTNEDLNVDGRFFYGAVLKFNPNNGKFSRISGGDGDNCILNLKSVVSGNFSDIDIDFSKLTMYDNKGTSTAIATTGDENGIGTGRRKGEMIGVSVQNNGMIFASYDNGMTKLLGQIATANFANASGLQKEGDNLYSATLNSGTFNEVGVDVSASGGYISSGMLEMSNVDLSTEFTEMITTQRGFQANSRIITVSDTLLEELTNLKR